MCKLVKSWFQPTFSFINVHITNLTDFSCVYPIRSQKATEAHSHTSDEFVSLTLLSERVSNTEKAKIVDSFLAESGDRQVRGDSTIFNDEITMSLSYFSGK